MAKIVKTIVKVWNFDKCFFFLFYVSHCSLKVYKVSLGPIAAFLIFPIFDNLVCEKYFFVQRTDLNFVVRSK